MAAAPPADVNLLVLDRALAALAAVDERKSRVIEMRFFGGMTVEETAEALRVSTDTVKRDWRLAKLWLMREIEGQGRRLARDRRSCGARRSATRRSMPRGGPNSHRRRSVPERRPRARRSLRNVSAAPNASDAISRCRRTARRVGSTTSSSASCTVRARASSGVPR